MAVARLDDLYIDGICIRIDWDAWELGMSVFVPCIKYEVIVRQVDNIAKQKGFHTSHRMMLHDGYLGVRIWRTT